MNRFGVESEVRGLGLVRFFLRGFGENDAAKAERVDRDEIGGEGAVGENGGEVVGDSHGIGSRRIAGAGEVKGLDGLTNEALHPLIGVEALKKAEGGGVIEVGGRGRARIEDTGDGVEEGENESK